MIYHWSITVIDISFKMSHWNTFSAMDGVFWLLTISRSLEILILTRPSGQVAKSGPSQASAGWQRKSVSRQNLSCSQPTTVKLLTAPVQRRIRRKRSNLRRSVFQFRYLSQFMLCVLIYIPRNHVWEDVCWFECFLLLLSVNLLTSCEWTQRELFGLYQCTLQIDSESINHFLSPGLCRPAVREHCLTASISPSKSWNQRGQEISASQTS